MALVEVIQGDRTTLEVIDKATELMCRMGKTPARAKDTPGFIVNRVARPFYNEALRILGDGDATVESIDRIMRLAGNFRMGPFELMDLIGHDVNFAATESLYRSFFEDPRFRPSPIQHKMVMGGISEGKRVGVFTSMTKIVSPLSAKVDCLKSCSSSAVEPGLTQFCFQIWPSLHRQRPW